MEWRHFKADNSVWTSSLLGFHLELGNNYTSNKNDRNPKVRLDKDPGNVFVYVTSSIGYLNLEAFV